MQHKKHYVILLLCLLFASASAQINLREGIVITLAGDTLHGDIDYRTDAMNAQQCVFLADGAAEPQTYKPGEIAGYRFLDNGRYYVSREVLMPDSTKRTVFLEFLVRGQMSVYYLADGLASLFYFEQEDGTLAIARTLPSTASVQERRKELSELYSMLMGCKTAQKMLWDNDMTTKTATKVVTTFNNEVCPDGQCEIFKYRSKKTPKSDRNWHPSVKIGTSRYSFDTHRYSHFRNPNDLVNSDLIKEDGDTYSSFSFGAGVDIYVPRLCRGLQVQIHAEDTYVSGTSTHTISSYTYLHVNNPVTSVLEPVRSGGKTETVNMQFKAHDISLKFGPAYQLPFWKIQPRVGAGLSFSSLIYSYDHTENDAKMDETGLAYLGRYLNAGVLFPLKKGALILDCEYLVHGYADWDENDKRSDWDIKKLTFCIGYQF